MIMSQDHGELKGKCPLLCGGDADQLLQFESSFCDVHRPHLVSQKYDFGDPIARQWRHQFHLRTRWSWHWAAQLQYNKTFRLCLHLHNPQPAQIDVRLIIVCYWLGGFTGAGRNVGYLNQNCAVWAYSNRACCTEVQKWAIVRWTVLHSYTKPNLIVDHLRCNLSL